MSRPNGSNLLKRLKKISAKSRCVFTVISWGFRAVVLVGVIKVPSSGMFEQDDDFVVNFCLKAQWMTYETTQEMLTYAKARVSWFLLEICFNHL